MGTSSSAGVPEAFASETVVVPLFQPEAVEEAVEKYKGEIACIAIEPIPANNGLLIQGKEFLQFLRDLCDRENILLFFDEVISGFRVGFEGAAGYYGIQPDMVAYGKIIGGGLPVGAYGSSAEVMGHVAPDGPVYQAGTLSGNPVAMSAGTAQLTHCLQPGFYEKLEEKTKFFTGKILAHAQAKGYPFNITSTGSIFWLAFSENAIHSAGDIDPKSMSPFRVLHRELLDRGVYIGPSGYEVGFICAAHTEADLEQAASVFCAALDKVFEK